jgi:hypothetical protein
MRPTTPTATRAPRTHHHRTALSTQRPPPSPTPRPQRTTTTRTHQLTPGKPVLDPSSVHPYREHSASARDTALPDTLRQRDTGRAFACPHRHGAAAHQHHTATGTHQEPSAHSMPGTRPRHRHPQSRSTGPGARRDRDVGGRTALPRGDGRGGSRFVGCHGPGPVRHRGKCVRPSGGAVVDPPPPLQRGNPVHHDHPADRAGGDHLRWAHRPHPLPGRRRPCGAGPHPTRGRRPDHRVRIRTRRSDQTGGRAARLPSRCRSIRRPGLG